MLVYGQMLGGWHMMIALPAHDLVWMVVTARAMNGAERRWYLEMKIREVSKEGRALIDRATRFKLDMSGEEFLAAWTEEDSQNSDQPEVVAVAALFPFAR